MAFRVRNTNAMAFGVMANAVTVTHGRFRLASDDSNPVVRALASPLSVQAGRLLQVPALGLAVKYNSGDLPDGHMEAAIKGYWSGISFEVDLMTSSTVVVADSGYSQQSTDAWTFDKPADT